MTKIQIYFKSIAGKEKKQNQDFYFWKKNVHQQILLGIADGVGSYENSYSLGKIVSQILQKNFIEQNFENLTKEQVKNWLKNIIEIKIHKEIKKISEKAATTLSIVILDENKSYLCHIGNTRIYQFDKARNKTFCLTQDHEFHKQSEDTFSWMKGEKFLTNSISNTSNCYIDVEEIQLKPGYLILTTDGMHDFIDQHFIYQTLSNKEYTEKEKIELLFEKSRFAGSLDDITCLLAKIN